MNKIQVNMLLGECWYAMDVSKGISMPIDKSSQGEINLVDGTSQNQCMPLLLSNHGRYIWCEDGFLLTYSRGKMTCVNDPSKHSIDLFEGYGTLREAYLDACNRFFSPTGKVPDESLFREPLFCTYAGLDGDMTEKSVLEYARGIIDAGVRPGILTIDYGWEKSVGDFEFDLARFPQPKMMMDELHRLGFKVRLWVCPFVSTSSLHYRYLKYGDMLVKAKNEKVAMRHWWNGKDALLDMSNPEAVYWFRLKCDTLIKEYGIDGFKFEGGDAHHYLNSDITYNAVDANTESMLWTKVASEYSLAEVRACYKCAGEPVVTRLSNKHYSYKDKGLNEIIPSILLQGILGYPYSCPDMVGGSVIIDKNTSVGEALELLVRYAEVCSLMPIVQFSLPIWKIHNRYVASLFERAYELHDKYANYIVSLAKNAAKTGEPIVRYLEYEFPFEGFHMVNDKFMLGSRYLVAPVLEPGKYTMTLRLPKGLWQYIDGKIYEGEVTVDAPLEVLPVFEKVR